MSREGSACLVGEGEDGHSVLGEHSNAGDRVVINVGGRKHETYIGTLKNIPDTRLYWITENGTQLPEFDPNTSEFFFDRHPGVFAHILNFYRTGKLHCPNDVCGPLFEDELMFWGIDEMQVEPCCWLNYKQHREAQANLNPFDSNNESDGESVSDMDMSVYGLVADSIRNRNRSWWKKYQPRIWTMFEEPYSSIPAQVVAFITLFLIIVSVVLFCLETVPNFNDSNTTEGKVLYILEAICVAWFTIEFLLRLIFCPNKLSFFKKPMNWIDLGAILPFYLSLVVRQSNIKTIVVLRVLRLIRVFRIFKLSRHSYGLQILGHTLRSSCSELFLLVFFLSIGVVIFSSVIYYAERDFSGTHFTTIPHTFWWAVVTMTTLGYGDMVPKTWQGQIVGSLCAVSGVLMIALPVPVIVSNFSLYYSHAKARMKLPRRRRPVIFGAASALRVAQPVVSSHNSPNVVTQLIEEGRRINSNNEDDSDDNFVPHRTPRNSGRRSPRSSIRPSSPRCRTPRNAFASPPAITKSSHSPTESVSSPLEPLCKKDTLTIPSIREEIELSEVDTQEDNCVFSQGGSELNLSPGPLMASSAPSSPLTASSAPVSPLAASSAPVSPLAASSLSVSPLVSPSPSMPARMPRAKSPLHVKNSDGETASTCSEVKSPLTDKLKNLPAKSLSSESNTGSPRGRRGRRGSLYIVGYTAKHWQNKALKKSRQKQSSQEGEKPSTSSTSRSRQSICEKCTQQSTSRSESTESSSTKATSPMEQARSPNSLRPSKNHKELVRVSSGTQTDDEMDAFEDTKATQSNGNHVSTMSVEKTNLSSKLSEESLGVHKERPRRGSSPLIRQHAVFTFDMNEGAQRDQDSGRDGSDGRARIPSGRRSTGAVRKKASSSPTYSEMSRQGSKKSKGRPRSLPSGYVNHSYQKDSEDSIPPEGEHADSVDSQDGDRPRKSFQPYIKPSQGGAPTQGYGTGRREPSQLLNPQETTSPAYLNKNMRTISLPPDPADRSAPYINHSMSLPMADLHKLYGFTYQGPITETRLHTVYDGRSPPQTETLLRRRQGPFLYLRMIPDPQHESYKDRPPIIDYRPSTDASSPFQGTLTSPSGSVYLASTDDFYTSGQASGLTSAASSGMTSAPGSCQSSSDSRFIYPGCYSYCSTPSSYGPPSSAEHVTSVRDCATSPMSFDDHFDYPVSSGRAEAPGQPSGSPGPGLYLAPHAHESRGRSWSAPAEAKKLSEHQRRIRSQTSIEYELVPVSRVADEHGQEYSVYVPNPISRVMFIPPDPGGRGDPVAREGRAQERKVPEGDEQTHAQDDDATVSSGDSRRDTPSPASTVLLNSGEITIEQFEEQTRKLDTDLELRTADGQSSCSSDIATEGTVSISKSEPVLSNAHLSTEHEFFGKESEHRHSFPTRKTGSPHRLERSDDHVIYNSNEPLRTSDSLYVTKRALQSPDRRVSSLPSPIRQRARAMFFGDSGISSSDSCSMSITHSLESELERDNAEGGTGSVALNPIHETEMETTSTLPVNQLPVNELPGDELPVNEPPDDKLPSSSSRDAQSNADSTSAGINLPSNLGDPMSSVFSSYTDSDGLANSVPTKPAISRSSRPLVAHVIDILNNADLYETSVV